MMVSNISGEWKHMTTREYKKDEWAITVQSDCPGVVRKDRWTAQAHRANAGILTTNYSYSSHDDAFNAINDMIHTEQANEERWRDYFGLLVRDGYRVVMRGDVDLTEVQAERDAEYIKEYNWQTESPKFDNNREVAP
jgi:hypothetical protein